MIELEEYKNPSLTIKQLSSKTFVYLDEKGREVLRLRQGWSAIFIRRRQYNQYGLCKEELLKEIDTATPVRVELLRERTFFPNKQVERSYSRGLITKKMYVKVFDSMGRRIRKTGAGTMAAYSWWHKVYETTPDQIVTEYNLWGRITHERYPNGNEIFLADLNQYRHSVSRNPQTGEKTEFYSASMDFKDRNSIVNCLEKTYWKNGRLKRIQAYQTQNGCLKKNLFFEEYNEIGLSKRKIGCHNINLTTQTNLNNHSRED